MPNDRESGWVNIPSEIHRVMQIWADQGYINLLGGYADNLSVLKQSTNDAMFWEAEKKIVGRLLPAHYQRRGTCVGQGWGRGCQDLMILDIAIRGEAEDWGSETVWEVIYAGSRVEVGGGRLGGDGSTGAWAAEWCRSWGSIRRAVYGSYDLRTSDETLAVSWGAPRRGVPDDLEPEVKQHPVQSVVLVDDADNGIAALRNYYPIPVCSNQGFTTVRDEDGFCYPRGSWSHCMEARGVVNTKNKGIGVAIQQSWGESPTGNNKVVLETGQQIELPQGVFLIPPETFHKMLRQGDSYAISQHVGYPTQKLPDWGSNEYL